ncbi:hypothetical protein [Streptomyces sp. NPDC058045]|uniref:hypothetical protein n=1 Tax=Streptomyces sp. NPDC058045 TaxID=3346311 RepID=UPI0036F0E0AA
MVRTALGVGVLVLAMLGVLATCGGKKGQQSVREGSPVSRFAAPAGYDNGRGWDLSPVGDQYTLAREAGVLAFLTPADDGRFTVHAAALDDGRARWTSPPFTPLTGDDSAPRLFTVTTGARQFFVTWTYGTVQKGSSVNDTERVVSLDVYEALHGTRRHLDVPWPQAPDVTGSGPGILIGRGSADTAVVDPTDGSVTRTSAKELKYPGGCADCRKQTEVRGLANKGLLVRGDHGFWLRGGWYSRGHAPKGTRAESGVPTSVTGDRVLAKWARQPASKQWREKSGGAAEPMETWAVHDAATGKVLATTDCRKPAIEPGQYPELVTSPSGRYLVSGYVAFDLKTHRGHCFDGGSGQPLTLVSVADDGTAYAATGVRDPDDALGGRGRPVQVSLENAEATPLAPATHVPFADIRGQGLFDYSDNKDVRHLVAYPVAG